MEEVDNETIQSSGSSEDDELPDRLVGYARLFWRFSRSSLYCQIIEAAFWKEIKVIGNKFPSVRPLN